jgi:hypothetical protein
MVLCTVHRVSPSNEPVKAPEMVQPFMNKNNFDKGVGKK